MMQYPSVTADSMYEASPAYAKRWDDMFRELGWDVESNSATIQFYDVAVEAVHMSEGRTLLKFYIGDTLGTPKNRIQLSSPEKAMEYYQGFCSAYEKRMNAPLFPDAVEALESGFRFRVCQWFADRFD